MEWEISISTKNLMRSMRIERESENCMNVFFYKQIFSLACHFIHINSSNRKSREVGIVLLI